MSFEPITNCSECGEAFDVYRAPDERVCEACKEVAEDKPLLAAAHALIGIVTSAKEAIDEANGAPHV